MNSTKKTFEYLCQNWAFCCPFIAFYTLLVTFSFVKLPSLVALAWIQFAVYLLHQWEEHWFPGNFKTFINETIFGIKGQDIPLDDRLVFWINIPAIWILFPLCAFVGARWWLPALLIPPVFGLFNATTHIATTLIKRRYNPGLGVSLLLNYPTGIYMLLTAYKQGLLTLQWGFGCFIFALLCHLPIVLITFMRYHNYLLKK